MSLDLNLVEQLLREEEGPTLDFKGEQYAFEGENENAKSNLLKDILAFTNAWRRSTAYILIGVQERKGERSKVVGVSKHLDDADLQQFVNSKTHRPVEFSYQVFAIDGVKIGIIEIPVQERPRYLLKRYGKVQKGKVYLRRGSSNSEAIPDEIAQMGATTTFEAIPQLVLQWADLERRIVLPSPFTAHSLVLDPRLPEDTFKSSPTPRSLFQSPNLSYSKEVIDFTFLVAFLTPIGFQVRNSSGVVGKRIRFIGSVPKDNGILVQDWADRPNRPSRHNLHRMNYSVPSLAASLRSNPDPDIRELDDRWEITIDFGDVRPRDEVWTSNPVLVGSIGSKITKLQGELRGDNLPNPIPCALEIHFEAELRPMEQEDVEPYLDAN